MAKKPPAIDSSKVEVVEEFHVADESVEYADVTHQDDLPEGVADVAEEVEEEKKPAKKVAKTAAKAEETEDDVPAELKGKTPAQLAKMYRDAQSVIGRQGTELGDLRKTADTYIKAHLQANRPKPAAQPAEKAPDDVDFFTNPKDAIAKAVANHPLVKELQGAKRDIEAREVKRHMETVSQKFNIAHPDAPQILNDEQFQQWVVKSPIRKAMLLAAHQRYDLDSANELFNTWKELHPVKAPEEVPAKVAAKPVAKAAAARVPSGGNASPRSQAGGADGKIYRRADVIRLMQNDPARYELMADEITKAYTEGRVR